MINLINDNNLDNDSLFPNELYDSHYPDGIEFHYWNIARFKIINQSIKNIDIPIRRYINWLWERSGYKIFA